LALLVFRGVICIKVYVSLDVNYLITSCCTPFRSGPLQFDFVKDWMTWYAACAINNAVNSTVLGHGLWPALTAAS